ncbi:MAG: hypothetical protein ABIU05_04030, partial [Nitrospirales bacterium]
PHSFTSLLIRRDTLEGKTCIDVAYKIVSKFTESSSLNVLKDNTSRGGGVFHNQGGAEFFPESRHARIFMEYHQKINRASEQHAQRTFTSKKAIG